MKVNKTRGPLEGIRILDLSTVVAAPYGAALLGDFGAEVIKVEMPEVGDPLRNLGPYYNGEGLRWPGMSRNKKSITLDLRQEEGKEILRKLVSKSDMVIENFRTGTLEKWGIGYEDLKQYNPDLVMIRVTGYGQTGPYSHKAGFGTPATAFSGFTYLHGYPDRPPISPSFSLTDYVTGIYVAFAAVTALYHRDCQDEGTGQYVDVSLYESMFRMMEFLISEYDQTGSIKERSPGLSGHSAPAGNFLTKDGHWIILVTSSDKTFERLAKVMNREDMLTDERYHTNSIRLTRFDEVNGIVSDWVKTKTKDELQQLLDESGVPMSSIYSIKDIFEDPQYKARENIVEVDHPRLGKVKIPGVVPKFSETPGSIRQIAPELGEHNEEILMKLLELDEGTIASLKEKKVI
ncbi:CaiB/BaiF CoA-transferase family protein [Bacillus sp. EB600]|uniref:CaiB/BaiF CoA transferase family protein n=1 Tax=Bacillus sp. EB600 TaxID=2806345 RepID=UPI00210B1270|nr:CoA transferase [Bacillus sp. EB600]MCQ6281741.1 CoA transferase [Bacillus sp. EB600]